MKIYFAHPAFTDSQREFKAQLLKALNDNITNFDGRFKMLDPFAYSPNIEGDLDLKRQMAGAVVKANIELMQQSDLCIAVIDDRDIGVIWELGYLYSQGVPVITISSKNYDNNIMISHTVMAHIPNVLENIKNLSSVLDSQFKVRGYV